jgi:hypothetical protein
MSLESALADRLAPPAWATFWEVGDQTGFGQSRRADAVAMSVWPSRGLHMHGFELKKSRSDWKRELDDPAKSAPIQRFMDFWWVVAEDAKLVKDGELPPTWGLLVLQGGKLVQKTVAPKLTAEPLTRGFIASLLRSATQGMIPKSQVDAMVEERAVALAKKKRDWREQDAERREEQYQELLEKVRVFEQASGVELLNPHWPSVMREPKMVGAAVRHLLTHGLDYEGLHGLSNQLKCAQEELDKAIELAKVLPKVTEETIVTETQLAATAEKLGMTVDDLRKTRMTP